MARKITIDDILSRIQYKPKWMTNPLEDHVVTISFRDSKGFSASIEFGQNRFKTTDGKFVQDFYFERVDWSDYIDGDFISLDSNRRHDVIHVGLTWKTLDDVMLAVNKSLRKHFSKKVQ